MLYFKNTRNHYYLLGILAGLIIWASIAPLEYFAYGLHQIGTALMLIFVFLFQRKYGLSLFTFACYLAFLVIHIVGAHYLYSYVPYNPWFQYLFGIDLNVLMGWERNMYDRLVHFSYGFLLYPLFLRISQLYFPSIGFALRLILILQFVMASSVMYEWIEWWIAIGMSPEDAENYNGQQGDVWDAHKDMFIASIGTAVAGLLHYIFLRYQEPKTQIK